MNLFYLLALAWIAIALGQYVLALACTLVGLFLLLTQDVRR